MSARLGVRTARRAAAALLLAAAGAWAQAADDGAWLTDVERARARAAAEGKDLLLDFTGSDWCHPCIQLRKEVFEREAFLEPAREHFVLVELDFPEPGGAAYARLSPEQHRANAAEQRALGVSRFPTVILATPEGAAYAVTGYRQGGPEAYLRHLDKLRASEERAALAAHAAALDDPDASDAARLDAAHALLGRVVAGRADEVLATLEALDPDDTRGVLAPRYLDAFAAEHLRTPPDDWHAPRHALEALATRLPAVRTHARFHFYGVIVALELAEDAAAAGAHDVAARERERAADGLARLREARDVRVDLLAELERRAQRLAREAAERERADQSRADAGPR